MTKVIFVASRAVITEGLRCEGTVARYAIAARPGAVEAHPLLSSVCTVQQFCVPRVNELLCSFALAPGLWICMEAGPRLCLTNAAQHIRLCLQSARLYLVPETSFTRIMLMNATWVMLRVTVFPWLVIVSLSLGASAGDYFRSRATLLDSDDVRGRKKREREKSEIASELGSGVHSILHCVPCMWGWVARTNQLFPLAFNVSPFTGFVSVHKVGVRKQYIILIYPTDKIAFSRAGKTLLLMPSVS